MDTTGDIVDYVKTIISNTLSFALEYLMDTLNANENLLVRMVHVPNTSTTYEIYYDVHTIKNVNVESLTEWMAANNDFSADDCRYTEIVNGHQKNLEEIILDTLLKKLG